MVLIPTIPAPSWSIRSPDRVHAWTSRALSCFWACCALCSFRVFYALRFYAHFRGVFGILGNYRRCCSFTRQPQRSDRQPIPIACRLCWLWSAWPLLGWRQRRIQQGFVADNGVLVVCVSIVGLLRLDWIGVSESVVCPGFVVPVVFVLLVTGLFFLFLGNATQVRIGRCLRGVFWMPISHSRHFSRSLRDFGELSEVLLISGGPTGRTGTSYA